MGGYPNYTLLAKTAGIKTGFVGKDAADGQKVDFNVESVTSFCRCPGCIRQLVIQGEEVIFKDLHRNSTGVTNCPTCKDRPCQVSPPPWEVPVFPAPYRAPSLTVLCPL